MDYTKDAILIEGMKSQEEENVGTLHGSDENSSVDGGGSGSSSSLFGNSPHRPSFGTLSTLAMINGSKFIEKKAIMTEPDLTSDLLMKANRSLSGILESSSPASILEGQQYDDMNDTMDYIPMSMRPETYIVPVLFAIIFIIGVIGNGTLIVIFIKHRSMRNVPNMFIVSLAIGDLLVILFCVPFTSTLYTLDSWPYGLVVCKFSEFVKDLSVGVSVFTLTALSADRYFAIVDPMRKLTGRRATRITIISIIGIWTLSVLVALPSALYSYIRVFPDAEEGEEANMTDDGRTFQVCYPYPTEFGPTYAQVMVMFHFLVYYAVPLLFIATFYIIMARHLVLSTRNMPGEAQGQAKQIQARKKVAKMILSFVVIFAICFFPHHLFLLWFYFYPDSENSFNAFWNICRIVGFCLSFMNSCINPITLYCVSGTFRKQFNDHLFCCFCDEPGNRPARGGRASMGGTVPGGGGGHGGGLCAGCVSLSGNHGQGIYGNDSRYGNGSLGRNCNGRVHRGSTWENSDRMMSKRKSTWETQTTVVNHRLLNMTNGGAVGSSPNIHVNLCSEPENIPLINMNKTPVHHHHQHHHHFYPKSAVAAVGSSTGQGTTTIISTVQENTNDDERLCGHTSCQVAPNASSTDARSNNVAGKKTSSYFGYNSGGGVAPNGSKCINGRSRFQLNSNPNDTMTSAKLDQEVSETGERENPRVHCQEQQQQQQQRNRFNRPSLIEEETSLSEQESKESGNSVCSNKSSTRQLSPNKTYSKVGELFSKISGKYSNSCSNSPAKHLSTENSSPSKKSPTKVAPLASGSAKMSTSKGNLENGEENDVVVLSYNNNNNITRTPRLKESISVAEEESVTDECEYTVTSLIVVSQTVGIKLE